MTIILSNPDITVYYSSSHSAGAVFTQSQNGPNLIQSLISPLYTIIPPSPPNLNISVGSVCVNGTIFDINNTTKHYDTITLSILYLQNGSISYKPLMLCIKDNITNDYLFLPNSVNVFEIISGTGEYLNCKGFVEFIIDSENINRKLNIYFLKTYSATASASATKLDKFGNTITISETASATSSVSAEDAYKIALTTAQGLINL